MNIIQPDYKRVTIAINVKIYILNLPGIIWMVEIAEY